MKKGGMTAVILGGGISGLSSAYYLVRNGNPFKRIILLEASDRVGGWIQTSRLDNGALFEHGPRSMRVMRKAAGRNSLSLATELGLSNDLIAVQRSHPGIRNRYIYCNNKLHTLPASAKQVITKHPLLSQPLYKTLWKERNVPKSEADDESIHSFFSRRLEPKMADYIFNPVMRGIFAGDVSKLSVKSCLPDLYEMEQTYGSLVRAILVKAVGPQDDTETYALNDLTRSEKEHWALWSLRHGLSQLTDRLEDVVTNAGVEIRKCTPCQKLEFSDNIVKVHTQNETITADHVVSSILSQDLAKLLENQHRTLADCLNQIPAVSVIVVNLEYKNYMPKFEGFGHLLPSSEDTCVLGVIYDSSTFKQHDTAKYLSTRYTVMLGGAWYDDLVTRLGDLKESTIQKFACQIMRDHLDIQSEPSAIIVSIQKNCIPQYYVGHSKIISSIDNYIDNNNLPVSLVGSSYKGVSVNDCILNAKIEMKKIRDKLLPEVHKETTKKMKTNG